MSRRFWTVCVGALSVAWSPAVAERLPSLDELLGLVEPGEGDADEGLLDVDQAELERELTEAEAREQLEQAVDLMGEAADRLSAAEPDSGLPTQRLQEDVLRKLDMVIDAADQQQQNSSSSSSSSSSSQQQQGQQSQSASASSSASGDAETMPSDGTDAELDAEFLAEQAEWGALPERTRDALLEGLSDSFSSLYRRLTEAYYRRLAEPAEGDE